MCSDNDSLLSRFLFDLRINTKLPEPLQGHTITRSVNRTLRFGTDHYCLQRSSGIMELEVIILCELYSRPENVRIQ